MTFCDGSVPMFFKFSLMQSSPVVSPSPFPVWAFLYFLWVLVQFKLLYIVWSPSNDQFNKWSLLKLPKILWLCLTYSGTSMMHVHALRTYHHTHVHSHALPMPLVSLCSFFSSELCVDGWGYAWKVYNQLASLLYIFCTFWVLNFGSAKNVKRNWGATLTKLTLFYKGYPLTLGSKESWKGKIPMGESIVIPAQNYNYQISFF